MDNATIEEKTLEEIDALIRANESRVSELIELRQTYTSAFENNTSVSCVNSLIRSREFLFDDDSVSMNGLLTLQNERNASIGAMVPSRLWKFMADGGGVCQHLFEFEILTKLNGSEIKFLYGTNTESRLAIKRAKIKLEDKFWIPELSSISQLELAWANYEWGSKGKYTDGTEYTRNQEMFCARVAETNDLALLRWVREEKECDWDWNTSGMAAIEGNLEMLKYCVENGCEVGTGACADAAEYGNLECLKYLHQKNCRWDERVCKHAHENDHIACLTYAVHQKCPGFEGYTQHVPAESQKK
jgi:hypothetical protein